MVGTRIARFFIQSFVYASNDYYECHRSGNAADESCGSLYTHRKSDKRNDNSGSEFAVDHAAAGMYEQFKFDQRYADGGSYAHDGDGNGPERNGSGERYGE
jgi:hypothetical protein